MMESMLIPLVAGFLFSLSFAGEFAFAQPDSYVSRLTGRIWLAAGTNSPQPKGSLVIFLPNGTLLNTSCVETYRISTWEIDPKQPDVLRVNEDGRPAYTAKITQLSSTTLAMRQTLTRSKEVRNVRFQSARKEFVCPDLPR